MAVLEHVNPVVGRGGLVALQCVREIVPRLPAGQCLLKQQVDRVSDAEASAAEDLTQLAGEEITRPAQLILGVSKIKHLPNLCLPPAIPSIIAGNRCASRAAGTRLK